MSQFNYLNNELSCENLSILDIAKKVKTPFYIYSYRCLVENFTRLERIFGSPSPLICYSLKANSNLTLSRILAHQGAGCDVASGGELYQALKAGFSPEKIVFAGVGKTSGEIKDGLKKNILMFNVESEGELNQISCMAKKLGKVAPVSLRINPGVDAHTHQYITTGKKENKFGLSFFDAEKLYEKARKQDELNPIGIHMHIGSQITTLGPYLKAWEKLEKFLAILEDKGINLKYVDIGGGFGISYRENEEGLRVEPLAKKILSLQEKRKFKLILEPGRYLTGKTGALITQVLYKKKGEEKTFLIVDAGMNDLIRPSLYGAYHRILKIERSAPALRLEIVDVVGPVCESGDFFAQERQMPFTQEGECLAIMDTGAYGFSMSSTYNGRPRIAEILVKDKKWWMIRQREGYEDLIKGECIPEELFTKAGPAKIKDIPFAKFEGSGNDFVVINNYQKIIQKPQDLARKICKRKKGIGADGLILIERAKKCDFTMRTFNPDGSEAEMCGNGARCAAKFACIKEITGINSTFKTLAGTIKAQIKENTVKITMKDPFDLQVNIKLTLDGVEYQGYYVNTGVPHLVIFSSEVDKIPLKDLAPKIRYHQLFQPQGTNVDFVEVKDDRIKTRTYERGVEDETLGCGTGAVASAIATFINYQLLPPFKVIMKGGEVTVWFEHQGGESFTHVFLEGEANLVYQGSLKENEYV